jgi:sugar lactone lactonase YvrE
MRTTEARVYRKPRTEDASYLPERPRVLTGGVCDVVAWINIQAGTDSRHGDIHGVISKFSGDDIMVRCPGRPGFLLPCPGGNRVLLGIDKSLRWFDLLEAEWSEPLVTIPDVNPRTIINDAEVVPGGKAIVFGTKDTQFKEPIAHLYLYTVDDNRVSVLADRQVCSNGKVFRTEGDSLILFDIDTPTRKVVRYRLDVAARTATLDGVALELADQIGFPDGMCGCGDGTVIVAFYNPDFAEAGRAVRFDLSSGKAVEVWTTPGSPRVTCPLLVKRPDGVKLILTTATEGMPAEMRAKCPSAGCLFIADTQLKSCPEPDEPCRAQPDLLARDSGKKFGEVVAAAVLRVESHPPEVPAMLVCFMVCVSVVVPALADDPKPPKPQHIPSVMRALHMKGRQVYRSLDQLLISGRSTVNERELFAEFYESLQLAKPPQGTVESWRYDIDRILGIVKEMDEAKDEKAMLEAGTKLLHATNCAACHEKYRYAPKPAANEVRPKSLDAGLKAVAAGGKHWSAPQKLDLGETKYMQPGRRLIVWPAEDVVHEARRGDRDTAVFAVKFKWALLPGAEPTDSGLLWYNYYDLGNKNASSYYHAKSDFKAREGEFTESFTVQVGGRAAGEYELAFVPQVNGTVWVPAANFVKMKYRLPK